MGAPNRISFQFTKFLGLGLAVDTFPYAVNIAIVIPLFTLYLGLGKPYTETSYET
jgi:hypothetical protein